MSDILMGIGIGVVIALQIYTLRRLQPMASANLQALQAAAAAVASDATGLGTDAAAVASFVGTLQAGEDDAALPAITSILTQADTDLQAARAKLTALLPKPPAVTPTSATVPVGAAVSLSLEATGFAGPVTFTQTSPAGDVTVNSTGLFSGTPAAAETLSITGTATDGTNIVDWTFTLTVQ